MVRPQRRERSRKYSLVNCLSTRDTLDLHWLPVSLGAALDRGHADAAQALRQRYSAPIVDHFKAWLDRHLPATVPKALLGRAIRYTLRFWSRLTPFLRDGRVPLSNYRTEQAIKTVVIGRKNFLFAYSSVGARALANLYALVKTAKANRVEPWTYLKQVFTALPLATTVEQVEVLLPWIV